MNAKQKQPAGDSITGRLLLGSDKPQAVRKNLYVGFFIKINNS